MRRLLVALAVVTLLAGCGTKPVELYHVHGLGFAANGTLYVPAHYGFRTYADGKWQAPDVPEMDYMGFVATDDGFYSSGHPGKGSDMPNPIGLVKSGDGGKRLTQLGFAGASDFHMMGVGYKSHAIYVLNMVPNAQMQVAGLYHSEDDGKTWKRSATQGIQGNVLQVAVHRTQPGVIALATDAGLFISSDFGDSFTAVSGAGPTSAVVFGVEGDKLYFGTNKLYAYHLASKQVLALKTPEIGEKGVIGYIAESSAARGVIAISTYARDVWLSKDDGQSWQQIARQGTGINAR